MIQKPLYIAYSDTFLNWKLGVGDGSHATNPVRAKLAVELLTERLHELAKVHNPQPDGSREIDLALLKQIHDHDYVDRVMGGDCNEWYYHSKQVAEAGLAMFGGTVRCVEAILNNEATVAFNPQGAKHHAHFARSAGFCVFNDMAYAAVTFKANGLKPLYLDWDIHAGDGVAEMLKGEDIRTISIHAADIFPGDARIQTCRNKRGVVVDEENDAYGINVLRQDGDEEFIKAIDAAIELIREYQPDVILLAAGADGHTGRGNLGEIANFTSAGYKYAAERVAEVANEFCQGRVLIGGAGGYQPLKETPETWALVVETIYNNTKKGE